MPAKPVRVGPLSFSRKGDANDFLKDMLYKYDLGDKVTDEDAAILTLLVHMHPEAAEKIGAGIESFRAPRFFDYFRGRGVSGRSETVGTASTGHLLRSVCGCVAPFTLGFCCPRA